MSIFDVKELEAQLTFFIEVPNKHIMRGYGYSSTIDEKSCGQDFAKIDQCKSQMTLKYKFNQSHFE